MSDKFQTRTATIWRDDDGIIHVVSHEGSVVTPDAARDSLRIVHSLIAEGEQCPVLVDIRRVRSLDRKVRVLFSGPQTVRFTLAAAMVVDSPLSRMVGNFFLTLHRPPFPTRMFSSEDEALAWLRGRRRTP